MLIRDRPIVGFTGGASDQIKISWQFVTRPDWSGEQRMHIWSQCYTSHLSHEMQKHAHLSHQISHLSWINYKQPQMIIWGDDDHLSPKDDQAQAHWNFAAMQMGSNGTASSFLIESTTERGFGNRAVLERGRGAGCRWDPYGSLN